MSKKKRKGRAVSLPVSIVEAVTRKTVDKGRLTNTKSDSALERNSAAALSFPI